jgi:REP element-mobilizing transposase RayT
MARIARVVAAGIPHHITQRGNRRQLNFFCEDDYREYISLMAERCFQYALEGWAYCLMGNTSTCFSFLKPKMRCENTRDRGYQPHPKDPEVLSDRPALR